MCLKGSFTNKVTEYRSFFKKFSTKIIFLKIMHTILDFKKRITQPQTHSKHFLTQFTFQALPVCYNFHSLLCPNNPTFPNFFRLKLRESLGMILSSVFLLPLKCCACLQRKYFPHFWKENKVKKVENSHLKKKKKSFSFKKIKQN